MATLVDGLASLPIEDRAKAIKPEVRQTITKYINDSEPAARIPATTIALWWNDAKAIESARLIVADAAAPLEARLSLARTLGDARAAGNIPAFAALAGDGNVPICLRQVAIDAIGNSGGEKSIVGLYANLPAEMKPAAINTLTRLARRRVGAAYRDREQDDPVARPDEQPCAVDPALGNSKVAERLEAAWGTIKTERVPNA